MNTREKFQNRSRRLGSRSPMQPRGGRVGEHLEHAQLYLADDGIDHGSRMRHFAQVSDTIQST